jgi:nitroimidazol reductase NimA-like FMN-containing flavoprotein (pyridoxamine 5'-phosphate oxidase superfamily)
MDSQDVGRELNNPGAQELLHSATLARLAYTGKDGFPRVIPIGFYWNGSAVVVCTAPISPKVAALSARPEVALTIDTGTLAAKSVLIRGLAVIEEVDGIPEEYLLASGKAMDQEQLRGFEATVRRMYKQMSRISIIPRWARYYDFGSGRVPGFLLKLASNS